MSNTQNPLLAWSVGKGAEFGVTQQLSESESVLKILTNQGLQSTLTDSLDDSPRKIGANVQKSVQL